MIYIRQYDIYTIYTLTIYVRLTQGEDGKNVPANLIEMREYEGYIGELGDYGFCSTID